MSEEDKYPDIGAIILAAGSSTRLGTPKQLLPYRGQSLLRHAAETAVASRCRPVVVVLPPGNVFQKEIASLPVAMVENMRHREGMSTSIRAGIEYLEKSGRKEAVVIMVCDQPFVSPSLIHLLCMTYLSLRLPIVACEYAGTLGVPALFACTFFHELLELTGDRGAKAIIYRHRESVASVPFPQGSIDIDSFPRYSQILFY